MVEPALGQVVFSRTRGYHQIRSNLGKVWAMVIITFPDKETQQKALGFLLGRFSGKVLKSGEHIVPEAALAALAGQDIVFTVQGRASYEQQVAALRGTASGAVQ
jgi:hypothetical protein